mmetsp:Transcript_122515/g.273607  ORF Transcript_122515/g.273607 Transcript_122515/m.273607 type:complete len:288 (+) Transcript_122515:81-944(+)
MDQLNRLATWLGGGPEAGGTAEAHTLSLQEDDAEGEEQIEGVLQQFSVLLEYERLQDFIPSGMYVMPSLDSVLTWHGTLFARHGLYRGGVFKFTLQLPEDYPESPPDLCFVSEVFHPMVEPSTGRVDLGAIFPEWRPGRDYASFALPHLHKALLRREYFAASARPPLNPEARELFLNSPAEFAERAAECARSSLCRVHENASGCSLQFTKGPVEAQDSILESLKGTDPSLSLGDRQADFVDWFLDHYTHQPVHAHVSTEQAETICFNSAWSEADSVGAATEAQGPSV